MVSLSNPPAADSPFDGLRVSGPGANLVHANLRN
jgi:hypothetical protein